MALVPTRKNSPGIGQPQAHTHLSATGDACLWLASLLHQPGSESTHAHLQTLFKHSQGGRAALRGLSITTKHEAFSFSLHLWRQEVHLWLSSMCYNDGGFAFLREFSCEPSAVLSGFLVYPHPPQPHHHSNTSLSVRRPSLLYV